MYRSTRFSPCTFWILFKFKFSRTSPCRKIRFEIGRSYESVEIVYFCWKRSCKLRQLDHPLLISGLSWFMVVQYITLLDVWPYSFMTVQFCEHPGSQSSSTVNNNFGDRSIFWTSSFLTMQFSDHPLLWRPYFAAVQFMAVLFYRVHFQSFFNFQYKLLDRPFYQTVHFGLSKVKRGVFRRSNCTFNTRAGDL